MSDDMDEDINNDDEKDLSSADVVNAYKLASDICNSVMLQLLQHIQPGQTALEICALGDKLIEDSVTTASKKKGKKERGLAFPTCVSVNNCVGHFSPLPEDPPVVLKAGDTIKIDLGIHVDGYVSQCAHTTVIGHPEEAGAIGGRTADAICAAYFAAEAAVRLLRPGRTNTEITSIIKKIADVFHCNPVEGVLSHQIKRNVIDGNNVIINRADIDQQVEEFKFEANQVYIVDIVMSTGEGKTKETTNRTTVFKRALDRSYQLKIAASRALFSEINKKSPCFPFTLRSLDEKKRRLGIVEIVKHELLDTYPVLWEKDGEIVVQFKFTALVLPSQTLRLNTFPLPHVSSEYSVDNVPEIAAVMQLSIKKRKPNKKKKPKNKSQTPAQGGAEATGGDADADGQAMETEQ